jgi:hypothetical protein
MNQVGGHPRNLVVGLLVGSDSFVHLSPRSFRARSVSDAPRG